MTRALRRLIGMALGVVGVTAPAWGIFHLVRTPSCGSDGTISYGQTCPDEMALWIVAIVVSATILLPLAVVIAGAAAPGRSLLLGPVLLLTPLCFAAGIAWSLTGPSSDPDTHWVGWLVTGFLALIVLLVVRGAWGMRGRAPVDAAPAPAVAPATTVSMGTLAAQLSAVAEARQVADGDGLSLRLQRLDELRAAGTITAAEHAHRRREILDEV